MTRKGNYYSWSWSVMAQISFIGVWIRFLSNNKVQHIARTFNKVQHIVRTFFSSTRSFISSYYNLLLLSTTTITENTGIYPNNYKLGLYVLRKCLLVFLSHCDSHTFVLVLIWSLRQGIHVTTHVESRLKGKVNIIYLDRSIHGNWNVLELYFRGFESGSVHFGG